MKRHHLLPLLAFFICLLNSCGNAPKSSVESPQKVVIAYVTSWSEIMPNPALVTHINYAFGTEPIAVNPKVGINFIAN